MQPAVLDKVQGHLTLPFGSSMSLHCVCAKTGKRLKVPILVGRKLNHYFAFFAEDDVDFEIDFRNKGCENRCLGFELKVNKESYRFIVDDSTVCTLRALDTNGGKLHFVRQGSENGQHVISTFATSNDITYEEAAIIVSQLKFRVQFSTTKFVVRVRDSISGQLNTFDVYSMDFVQTLTRYIRDWLHVPQELQVLKFRGTKMSNDDTFEEYGIKANNLVIMEYKMYSIYVQLATTSSHNNNKTRNRKRKIIKISCMETVGGLKQLLIRQRKFEVRPDQQLVFSNARLRDDEVLKDIDGINDEVILELIDGDYTVDVVTPTGQILGYQLRWTMDINLVKNKITKSTGILAEHQTLTFNGVTCEGDDVTLGTFSIGRNSELHLTYTHFPIYIRSSSVPGSDLKLSVTRDNTIGQVKKMINGMSQLALSFHGDFLEEEDLTLEDCGISYNDYLYIPSDTEPTIVISVFHHKRQFQLEVFPCDLVAMLMKMIKLKCGISPAESVHLNFNGKPIVDFNWQLMEYRLEGGSEVYCFESQRGGGSSPPCVNCCKGSCSDPSCPNNFLEDEAEVLGKTKTKKNYEPDIGEPGAVCLGDKSSEIFGGGLFHPDDSVKIEPFVLELRLKSSYSALT